jgi:RimJ/RimL family protein N-acetyltransferase
MPSIQDPTEPLSDGRVALRLAAERDIPEVLIAHQDDPELHLRRGVERPPSGAELGREMEEAQARRAAGESATLTILVPDSDECRGQLIVHNVDWDHRRAELGIWLAPDARGQGLAQGALRLAARWLFDGCGLERLQLITEPDNEPLLRTARAAGFEYEGILRGYTRERGRRHDCAVLSLLPGELTE